MRDTTQRHGAHGGLPGGYARVLVAGASRSGVAAALATRRMGRAVTLTDMKAEDKLPGVAQARSAGIAFVEQSKALPMLSDIDLVIKSPGVPGEADVIEEARRRGLPVWSEVELAYRLLGNPFDAITGTNGKTTTTALLGHLFKTAGRPVRVLGNIGTAITSALGDVGGDEELVVELSSFQLEDVHEFRPAAGIFLNLTPDHLDRHRTMDRYLECKANLFRRQKAGDVAVLNLDDPAVAALACEISARPGGPRVLTFSVRGRDPAPASSAAMPPPASDGGAAAAAVAKTAATLPAVRPDSWLEGGRLYLLGRPGPAVSELQLLGHHNMENCLAAATAGLARGLPREAVTAGLISFAGVEHRLERAGVIGGVTYVNDSKATNVEATLKALGAYPERTFLILGGKDKASDYRPVARACAEACKAVYLIGEAAPLIKAAFGEVREREGAKVPELIDAGDLQRAVRDAASRARAGDTVLLAPACASFDQYDNFEKRGEHFRAIVAALRASAPANA